jgi:hypothetical protein
LWSGSFLEWTVWNGTFRKQEKVGLRILLCLLRFSEAYKLGKLLALVLLAEIWLLVSFYSSKNEIDAPTIEKENVRISGKSMAKYP